MHLALLIATAVLAAWLLTQTHEAVFEVALTVWLVLVLAVAVMAPATNVFAVAALIAVVSIGCWIGANSPEVRWFGDQVAHGPRNRPEVAVTFDDGPNATATLAVARILDAHGAKGTFFEVGKAIDRRPDITRALLADGHLLGNHSYRHDSTHWLDPRYPELAMTQRSFQRQVGACPAFFRAPHGQHTPFMAAVVHGRGMVMAGWDTSAGDWKAHDPAELAKRVLDRVRPGSIIDLHDGLDGSVTVDRGVLVKAMPLILDGLAARHLRPVRLDVLLGERGYLPRC